jgi:hypothetical protein
VEADDLDMTISGEIWYWRGPSPFHFVTVPPDAATALRAVAAAVTYGWGMIPVHARIGDTAWTTSLFPRDGGYVVPIKDRVRAMEQLHAGDTVSIRLAIRR